MSECIDIHTHIVPENFPAYAGKGRDVPWPSMAEAHACHKHVMISGKIYHTVSEGCWSVPRRIEDMGAMRVTRQAISPMPELLSYWLPLDDARTLIRYLNDTIATMIGEARGRFIGLVAVPLQDVDAAIRELEYCGSLGFAGVEIASHVNGTSIGDPRYEPFFAAAEAMGAAGQERIVGPFSEQAVCFPGDIGLACASMITGGIGARHPRLRIAFSHGGGVMSILLARLVHAWNVLPKAKEALPESPAATARRFYYDELVFDPAAVRHLVATFRASQIMVGSDYPFALGDPQPLKTLEAAILAAATHAAICSGNAKRFLA